MGIVGVAGAVLVGVLILLILVEFISPARRFEKVLGWELKCLAFVPMIIGLAIVVPYLLSGLVSVKVLSGNRLGLVGGTLIGIVVSELLLYWIHRLHHNVDFLWRHVHQLHHSAERVDVFGAAYFHPIEIIEGGIFASLFFTVFLGLTPEAAALAGLWQAFAGIFQHGNINTPRWLGYFIQRPESHGVHHERGVHGYNYSNLPLWDMVFGTFKNPVAWEGLAGFYSGSSKLTWRMLRGHDISTERTTL